MAKRNFSSIIEQSLQGRTPELPAEQKTEQKEVPEIEKEKKETVDVLEEEKVFSEEPEVSQENKTPSEAPNRPKQATKSKSKDKLPPPVQKSENGAKFELKKKVASKKDNHSFYIKDANYDALLSLAKENNLSISEALDEILTQVLF